MRDPDLRLIVRAALLTASLICQRLALMLGRLALAAEAHYGRLTAAAHG